MALDGMTMVGYYVEGGIRKFADVAREMVGDLGEWVVPHLRGWYENVRWTPEFDNSGMSSPDEIEAALRDLARAPTSETEAEHGLQGPVPSGDAGARPEDVQPAPGRDKWTPRQAENAQAHQMLATSCGGDEGTGRDSAEPGGTAGGAGAGVRDTAGLPGTEGGSRTRSHRTTCQTRRQVAGTDYRIEPGEIGEGPQPAVKARGNLQAIRIVKRLTQEGGLATRRSRASSPVTSAGAAWPSVPIRIPTTGRVASAIGKDCENLLTPNEYKTSAR